MAFNKQENSKAGSITFHYLKIEGFNKDLLNILTIQVIGLLTLYDSDSELPKSVILGITYYFCCRLLNLIWKHLKKRNSITWNSSENLQIYCFMCERCDKTIYKHFSLIRNKEISFKNIYYFIITAIVKLWSSLTVLLKFLW